ncbi:MAG: SusC/RagA family TonB-linked outer membrane protein [Flavobacteriaceae bacterium]
MKTKFNALLTLFLMFAVQIVFAQSQTISGSVSDETGPLPGVSVVVEGTNKNVQTDFDGNYTIEASNGDVLLFSYVGMTPVQVSVAPGANYNVVMQSDNLLEEVVVMGYGTKKKSELTGSSVQVSAAQIESAPAPSVDQALQGQVAGLTGSTTSGTPGSTSTIRIRGISSITASNEPLYVVDGVPVTNGNSSGSTAISSLSPLATINSADILSVTVLKDASATAAYGARGSNGVIVITTKSGRSGKTTFSFDSWVGVQENAISGPTMLTAAEREMLYYEAVYNTYGEAYGFDKDGAQAFSEAFNLDGGRYQAWNANGRPEGDWKAATDNPNALTQTYNFTASGGDANSNFYASLGYYSNEGTVIGTDFDRWTAAFNYNTQLTKNWKFTTRNQVSDSEQNGILEQSAYFSSPRTAYYFMPPTEAPYNDDGSLNLDLNTNLPNPIYVTENDIRRNTLTRFLSNNSLEWDIPVEGLTFTTRYNIDYRVAAYKNYGNPVEGDWVQEGGYAYNSVNRTTNYTIQNILNYNWNITDEHVLDMSLIQEYQENYNKFLGADGQSFAAEGLTNLDNAGLPLGAYGSYTDWKIASYLAMANYSFTNKYVANATFRREGNSRFPTENRWGNFWSVGAAWNIHNEDFMTGADWIDQLKVRGSYGVQGNAGIGLNTYQALLSYDADYAGEAAVYPSTFGNDQLTWETSSTFDVGLDFSILNNALAGNVSVYKRVSDNLLQNVPLSLTTGFGSQNQNIGTMENKGVEVELNWNIIQSNDFNLSIGGNAANNANLVTKLAVDGNGEEITITTGTRKVETGHTVYEWFMRKYAGVNPDNGNKLYYVNGMDGETTEDYNAAERAYQGKGALPTFTAGMNFHVDFKGVFLDAQGYYAGGHQVYEDWTRYIHETDLFGTLYYNSINDVLDRWQNPGDVTDVSKVTYSVEPWRTHSKFLHDGDYFRLKNLTLGYDFQPKMLSKIGLDGLRLYGRGTNVFTWVKAKDMLYDPEVNANGFVGLTSPPVKTWAFGLNLKF